MIHLQSNEYFLNSKMSVTTEPRSPQQVFPEHDHSFDEIIVVSKGNGIHVVNDIPMNLSRNYVCFVGKKDRHLIEQVDELFLCNILYKKDQLSSSALLEKYLPQPEEETVDWFIDDETALRVNYIIERLDHESHTHCAESRAMSELLFQQLVVELWRGRIQDERILTQEDRLLSSIVFMNKNYDQPLNIDEIAQHVKVSSRLLSKAIKDITGMSFNQYLHFIRAKNAISLLINTDISVTDIAFMVGYSDSNYFSTKFKQTMHRKPSDIRVG
ncbi:AraC family transcriptional regulator [Vibrio sp. HA2012]|uniref:AraC family transcriptional regulator n=1 Tax=Vibrio sp. HA2012 TaxID=1971595 RepID=UPI000C2C5889|nr:AraC family transcriptional regulator [Vibrio sp. HA2012]PJC87180.1 AraC family transcriptional regulator [Vibrio sp. HA2012]